MDRPLVIQTEDLDADAAAWLGARCELVRCGSEDAAFAGLLVRAAGLVIRTYTRVDEGILSRAPRLRVVGRAGVGLENVDQEACRRRGIAVVNTPDANTSAVAEYVFAMMLDVLRPRMYLGRAGVSAGAPTGAEWHALRRKYVAERELNELTLGLWGFGRVGRAVARIAGGLGMRVIYNDLVEIAPGERWGGSPVDVPALLSESDVLSVHVDGRAANRGLVSAAALERVKGDVLLINTSRGFVVDAAALAAFLRGHVGAAAMLDVHEPEPIEPAYPLLDVANAWLGPHLASGTAGAKRRMSWVVRDVWAVLEGEAREGSSA
jgi:phosphoglycerate dehydrogenase-like enzyme